MSKVEHKKIKPFEIGTAENNKQVDTERQKLQDRIDELPDKVQEHFGAIVGAHLSIISRANPFHANLAALQAGACTFNHLVNHYGNEQEFLK